MKTAEPLWAASFCVLSPLPCKSFFICSNRIPCFILCPLTLILPVDTTKEFGFICFISSCQVFIHMDKMLVRVFLTQLRMPLGFFAARVYCWPKGSLVSTRPTGPVLQSCFPTCRLPVPMHGDISPRVQDFALHFVELHEICFLVSLLLKMDSGSCIDPQVTCTMSYCPPGGLEPSSSASFFQLRCLVLRQPELKTVL